MDSQNMRLIGVEQISTGQPQRFARIGSLSLNDCYYKMEDSNLDDNERKTFSWRLIWRDLLYSHLHPFFNKRDTSIRLHYEQTELVLGENYGNSAG